MRPVPIDGPAVRKRLAEKLASMSMPEIFDAIIHDLTLHSPKRKALRVRPIDVAGPTLVIAKKLGDLLKAHSSEEIISPTLGFLPGEWRTQYLTWYVEQMVPANTRGYYTVEVAKTEALRALRKIMKEARLVP